MLIDELLTVDSFLPMLSNPYGNYVVQKALEHADEKRINKLLKVLFLYTKDKNRN